MLNVFTDGAYSSARNQGGIGVVVVKDGKVIQSFNKGYKNTTNNKMELTAVISVLYAINKPLDKLVINTDSMYVIGCATRGWQRKKNQSLWQLYDRVFEQASSYCSDIVFNHVKGHDTNEYNNLADKLAVEASHLEL